MQLQKILGDQALVKFPNLLNFLCVRNVMCVSRPRNEKHFQFYNYFYLIFSIFHLRQIILRFGDFGFNFTIFLFSSASKRACYGQNVGLTFNQSYFFLVCVLNDFPIRLFSHLNLFVCSFESTMFIKNQFQILSIETFRQMNSN